MSRRRSDVIWMIAGAAVVALTVVAVRARPISDLELSVFRALNDLPHVPFAPLWLVMQAGNVLAVTAVALWVLRGGRGRLAAGVQVGGLVAYYGAKLVKRVARRARPALLLPNVHIRGAGSQGSGFVAGHAAVVSFLAVMLLPYLGARARSGVYAIAIATFLLRVYVGAHLPLDIVGGAAFGAAVGVATHLVLGRPTSDSGHSGPGTLGAADGQRDAHVMASTARASTSRRATSGWRGRADKAVEASQGRHPGDLVRLTLGLLVLGVAVLAVDRTSLTTFEADLFRLLNDLPLALLPYVVVIMQLGNIAAAPALATVAVVFRRRRLAIDLLTAPLIAYVIAKVVKSVVGRPRPGGLIEGVILHGTGGGMGFVSGHAAVAAALATAAGPYLPRRWRRVAWAVAGFVGASRVYVGAHLPLDVAGGAALGWAVGAAVHLVLGAGHRPPSPADARRALERSGQSVETVRRFPGQWRGSFPFVAMAGGTGVFVKLLDPESRDRDWVFRIARFLAFRDIRDEVMLDDTRAQGEREVAMTLLAREAGVRAPVIRALEHEGGRTWIVEDVVGWRSLDGAAPDDVSDPVLEDLWRQVARLHGAHIVHHDLVAANVVLDDEGSPWLVDFAHAHTSHRSRDYDLDVAELLVSTAVVVGAERAVRAALAVLGREDVVRCLSEMQPFALSAETRRKLRVDGDVLGSLRARTVGLAGGSASPATGLRSSRAALVGTCAGALFLIVMMGAFGGAALDSAPSTSVRWVGLAVLAGMVSWVQGGALVAAVTDRRLGLGATALVETVAVASRSVFGVSADAVRGRYLERTGVSGLDTDDALVRTAGCRWIATVVAAAALVAIARRSGSDLSLGPALVGGVAACLQGAALAVRRGRGRWRRRNPMDLRTAIVALSAALCESAAAVLVLVAAEKAVGGSAAIASVAIVGTGLAALSRLVGGGPGVVDGGGVLALIAGGMPFELAVAAMVVMRAVTFWLPVLVARSLASWLIGRLVL